MLTLLLLALVGQLIFLRVAQSASQVAQKERKVQDAAWFEVVVEKLKIAMGMDRKKSKNRKSSGHESRDYVEGQKCYSCKWRVSDPSKTPAVADDM